MKRHMTVVRVCRCRAVDEVEAGMKARAAVRTYHIGFMCKTHEKLKFIKINEFIVINLITTEVRAPSQH
jgi:hypothetical protein